MSKIIDTYHLFLYLCEEVHNPFEDSLLILLIKLKTTENYTFIKRQKLTFIKLKRQKNYTFIKRQKLDPYIIKTTKTVPLFNSNDRKLDTY